MKAEKNKKVKFPKIQKKLKCLKKGYPKNKTQIY